jgi:hypothetical protein
MANPGCGVVMKEVTYEDALRFLDLLSEKMPEWSYDDWDPEIEYIREMLWQYNEIRTS